jgi:two-component system LytT family response regulator
MKTLLVDDEPHNCELIESLLRLHLPSEIEVIGHAYSVDQAAEIIRTKEVELVFLDIQMPGKSGFELLHQFSPPHFELIFITSFDQYGLPAIQADAVAYLLKPVDVKELKRAVGKAYKMRLLRELSDNGFKESVLKQSSKIAVHEGGKVIYLNTDDIVSLQADGRYTRIALSNGHNHVITKTIKMIELVLPDTTSFLRINRSVILNVSYVHEYSKSEPYTVMLKNGSSFEVSRRKRKEILAELKSGKSAGT